MLKLNQYKDHIMLVADETVPESHKHLASHIILSIKGEMKWTIEGEEICCQGICISPDVSHKGITNPSGAVVFLFMALCNYTYSLEKNYLKGKPYAVLPDSVVEKMRKAYENWELKEVPEGEDDASILAACGLTNGQGRVLDERIRWVLSYVEAQDTITKGIMEELRKGTFLSESRLSHLFRQQTRMTLHSYLALKKLEKTMDYRRQGMTITESCLMAGFDSSSHCAATCKRMFGMTVREIAFK